MVSRPSLPGLTANALPHSEAPRSSPTSPVAPSPVATRRSQGASPTSPTAARRSQGPSLEKPPSWKPFSPPASPGRAHFHGVSEGDTEKYAGSAIVSSGGASEDGTREEWWRRAASTRVGGYIQRTLERYRIEQRGIVPVPPEERKQTQWWSVGLLWFSVNVNVLSFSTGLLAPVVGLTDLRSSFLTIFFFAALCSLPPAYFTVFGPKLGLRQMIQARFSWGYLPGCAVSILNCAGMLGYTILNTILGGQTLSAVAGTRHLPESAGMVIIAVFSLLVSFSGFRVVHAFERWLWLPVLVGFVTLLSVAGSGPSGLHDPPPSEPVTARAVLGMGTIVAGFLLSYAPLSSDVSLYYDPSTSSVKLFIAAYLGFFLSSAPLMMVGAAFGCAAPYVEGWQEAVDVSVGSLLNVVLADVGKFGSFITVVLALSVMGNIATTLYCFSLSLQTAFAWVVYIPRFCFPILATAVYLPLAIVGANKFYTTLSNFLALLAYWSSCFIAVVIIEHLVFRRSYKSYDTTTWNSWRQLPLGAAALGSSIISLALLVPSVDQAWYQGPIARRSGDLAFEFGFVVTAIAYVPLRMLERSWWGH